MADAPGWLQEKTPRGTLVLRVHVQPGAKQSEAVAIHGERLKIRVAARPVDGRANEALVEFMAVSFGVPKRDVTIVSGEHHRDKQIEIRGARARPDRDWAQRFGGSG